MKRPIVINLFAGAGAGKSTTAADIFVQMKKAGLNVELVREHAKDLCWEGELEYADQTCIFKEQMRRQRVLAGKVDFIVTDCPIILGILYSQESIEVHKMVVQDFDSYDNVNVFLKRTKEFKTEGRLGTLEDAKEKDEELLDMLNKLHVPYTKYTTDEAVVQSIHKALMRHT